ncbi:hypothetical protein XELAEV_18003226mg [Xenopus laevis]|nr:hypothetical protein XELAEV_18003226mg [Xenopus laevis]
MVFFLLSARRYFCVGAMEMSSYYTKLLGELNEQRKRDFFCDCSIIVEGRIFKAHRNVLFANSGYFRAMLVHYIQDSGRHSTASLDIVTSEAFSTILDFLYSGKLNVCGENVIEVMRDVLVVPIKLHKCPFCPYTAKQKGILKRHIRSHTGERPYPCDVCGKRFTRQEHLRSHALTVHRSNRPIICKGCRRTFTSNLSPGLRRFGLCDSCTCVTTTHDDSNHPGGTEAASESMDKEEEVDGDWPIYIESGDENEGPEEEEIDDKDQIHREVLM